MTRYLIGNLRTGRRLVDLHITEGPWNTDLNGPGKLSATVTLRDPDMISLALRNVATVGQAFLAVVENDIVMEAGPIWTHEYDRDKGKLEMSAAGMWTYFDHRVLVPVLAAGQSPIGADTNLSGLDLGTIAKRLVQQARAHTGGNVPIVFEADRAGTNERNYLGADLKLVGDALSDITSVDGGPDVAFSPRFTQDRLGVEWVLRTGSAAKPQLGAATVHAWDLSVPDSSVRGLKVSVRADRMVGRAWATGGRSADVALYSRFENPLLVDLGYPLLEAVDSSHSTVTRQSTLDGYTREAARTGSRPIEFWSFDVDAQASPRVGEYQVGDFCTLRVGGDDPYLPKGNHLRRIVALSGDEVGRWVSVTTGEVYSLDG